MNWHHINKVLVADEAIYHGTTFEKVLNLVANVKGDTAEIEAAPVVTTTEALNSDMIANALIEGTRIINQSTIPFYVDTIISKFLTWGNRMMWNIRCFISILKKILKMNK